MSLPTDAKARKDVPVASGVLDYFPDAIAAVAAVSKIGGEQHNPGKPLFWDRSKSSDESDALMRHFLERGKIDSDGARHSAKVAWRALALLQKEIEAAAKPAATISYGGGGAGGCGIVVDKLHIPVHDYEPDSPEGNMWLPWYGGMMPVDRDVYVDVTFIDGRVSANAPARHWSWGRTGGDGDIIAWRLA